MAKNYSEIDDIIVSFLKDKISLKEKKILENWLASSPDNKEYFKNIYKIWNTSEVLNENSAKTDEVLQKLRFRINDTKSPRHTILTPKLYSFGKWAAVILLSLATGAFIYSQLISHHQTTERVFAKTSSSDHEAYEIAKKTDSYNEITVPMGAKSKIRLPDGTEVTLNAGSKLTYAMDYGTSSRDVTFSGEGYFKVAKMKNKPFIVHTSKANIKALGTEFNVKAYPDENIIETILVEGSVVVNEIMSSKNDKNSKKLESVVLKPGQKVQIFKIPENEKQNIRVSDQNKNKKISSEDMAQLKIQMSNPEVETSWKDKRWIIQGENLQNLAVILSRKFDVKIQLEDPELNKYKFSGIIENETIEQVFQIMKYTIPISYTINKGEVTWSINRNLEKDYQQAY